MIHAEITVNDKNIDTYLCMSEDFKKIGENKAALDTFYEAEHLAHETPIFDHGLSLLFSCHTEEAVHKAGKKIPLTSSELQSIISDHIIDSAQAAEELGCSKQNIDDLVRRGKLTAVKEGQRYRLFMKSDIEQRRWK